MLQKILLSFFIISTLSFAQAQEATNDDIAIEATSTLANNVSIEKEKACKQTCRDDRKLCISASTCDSSRIACFAKCDKEDISCKKDCTTERNKCVKDSGCTEKSKECIKACKVTE